MSQLVWQQVWEDVRAYIAAMRASASADPNWTDDQIAEMTLDEIEKKRISKRNLSSPAVPSGN